MRTTQLDTHGAFRYGIAMMNRPSTDTASYYDTNTARFLHSQKGDAVETIHRALYAPGIENRREALQYSHELVLQEIQRLGTTRVLDLGCGVGASLRFLRQRHPECDYQGITVSKTQVDMAATHGVPVALWDYHEPGWFDAQAPFDLVYAIESLQHATDLEAVARNVHRATTGNGRFLVIDDFQSDGSFPLSREKIRGRYMKHWHAHGYRRLGDFIRTLEACGFQLEYSKDLSTYQRSRPLFNLVVYGLLSPLQMLKPVPSYAQNLLGGNALLCLQDLGLSSYHLLVFKRRR
jgi:cyclopropane fatty-acyl-phospholipid synthase-like methyltransferase